MPLVSAKCTNCGSNLSVENTKDAAICEFCGSAFIVENAINNYNITNQISNNISGSVVNIYGGNSADFVIRAGTLEKYTGAATDVVIPNSVTFINSSAFHGCIGLTSITIPNGVTAINSHTFSRCSELTSVTIPNSVTSIGDHAFSDCYKLTSIAIPASVTYLGNDAFSNCINLVTVHASKKIIDMYWHLFAHASFYQAYKTKAEEQAKAEAEAQTARKKAEEIARKKAEERRYIEESTKGACYLTTACMKHSNTAFDDNCHELTVLRSFRDTYLKNNYPDDIQIYYNTAPTIVETINTTTKASAIWIEIYDELVAPSVNYIEDEKLEEAYQHYKEYSLMLTNLYLS